MVSHLVKKVYHTETCQHSEIVELAAIFDYLRTSIEAHIKESETILFPLIKRLEAGESPLELRYGPDSIEVRKAEHQQVLDALERISVLLNGYVTPHSRSNTYRAMVQGLARLHDNFHLHIVKEESLLFPRAVILEALSANVMRDA